MQNDARNLRSESPVAPSITGLVLDLENAISVIGAFAERLSNAADRTATPPPREVAAGATAVPVPAPGAPLEVRLRALLNDIARESARLREVADRLDAAL